VDRTTAEHFAENWVAAWNSRNLPRILEHYEEDFEMSSPLIAHIAGERVPGSSVPSGNTQASAAAATRERTWLSRTPATLK
jgi:hypothetical protein